MIKEMIVVAYSNKKNRLAMILMRKIQKRYPPGPARHSEPPAMYWFMIQARSANQHSWVQKYFLLRGIPP